MIIQTLLNLLLKIFKLKRNKQNKKIPQDAAEIKTDTAIVTHQVIQNLPVPELQKVGKPKFLWCLDNGHGKFTKGKRSPILSDGSVFFEYEFNRIIVNRLIEEFDKIGLECYNVVPEVEIGNFLKGRVKRANQLESKLPKIFLSIHANAAPGKWTTAQGIETWANHYCEESKDLANVFQRYLIKHLDWKNRGVKTQKENQFYVLRKTKMNAVLLELGFYNNKEEVERLRTKEVQDKMVAAIVEAVLFVEATSIL